MLIVSQDRELVANMDQLSFIKVNGREIIACGQQTRRLAEYSLEKTAVKVMDEIVEGYKRASLMETLCAGTLVALSQVPTAEQEKVVNAYIDVSVFYMPLDEEV